MNKYSDRYFNIENANKDENPLFLKLAALSY